MEKEYGYRENAKPACNHKYVNYDRVIVMIAAMVAFSVSIGAGIYLSRKSPTGNSFSELSDPCVELAVELDRGKEVKCHAKAKAIMLGDRYHSTLLCKCDSEKKAIENEQQ